MRHYELMVILDPELEERTVAPSLDKFLNVIRNGGGTVVMEPTTREQFGGSVTQAILTDSEGNRFELTDAI